jgi:uncharacterized membrane protein (UPF0127 family)
MSSPSLSGLLLALSLLGCASISPSQGDSKPNAGFSATRHEETAQFLPVTARGFMGGETVALEVARTSEQIARGLMFRKELPPDRGMLFVYEPPQPARFWMKNVIVPLDVLFLRDGVVVDVAHSMPPCRGDMCPLYGPDGPVDQVIELRGGRAKELGLAVGDPVRVEFLD